MTDVFLFDVKLLKSLQVYIQRFEQLNYTYVAYVSQSFFALKLWLVFDALWLKKQGKP